LDLGGENARGRKSIGETGEEDLSPVGIRWHFTNSSRWQKVSGVLARW